MSNIAVIGGGIAGLSAAYHLSCAGYTPLVFESTKSSGGRASSHYDESFAGSLDNGQHILMGCYEETLRLFERNNLTDYFDFRKYLHVTYLSDKKYTLSAKTALYPFNLASAILSYAALSLMERLSVITFMKRVLFNLDSGASGKNVSEWLDANLQNEKIKKNLWAPLSIGAMNASLEKSSAVVFKRIIKRIFFTGNFSSVILVPKINLSQSVIDPISKIVTGYGAKFLHSNRIVRIEQSGEGFLLTSSSGEKYEAQYIISTIPLHALRKIEGIGSIISIPDEDFNYSSILSVHIKTGTIRFEEPFIGFTDSPIHWVFRHEDYISVVISDADKFEELSHEQIGEMVSGELMKYQILAEGDIQKIKVIREKRATFIPDNNSEKLRLPQQTIHPKVFLAGDWTDTGYPATIEGAAFSGNKAAELLLKALRP